MTPKRDESDRVRRIYDKTAPKYDRQIRFFERVLFEGGREWACSRARGETLVGLGALVRHQVPALIGISAWLLFVEGLLVGDFSGFGDVGRFFPGAAAAAITGQEPGTLVAPTVGLLLVIAYAAVAAVAGAIATTRRDVV